MLFLRKFYKDPKIGHCLSGQHSLSESGLGLSRPSDIERAYGDFLEVLPRILRRSAVHPRWGRRLMPRPRADASKSVCRPRQWRHETRACALEQAYLLVGLSEVPCRS